MIEFLRKLLAMTRPYRLRLGLGILFGILSGLVNPILVVTVKLVAEVVFPIPGAPGLADSLPTKSEGVRALLTHIEGWFVHDAAHGTTVLKVLVIALIPLVMLLRGLISYLNVYFMQWVAIRALTDLRTRLFHHLLNLSLHFFNRTSTGELMSRIVNDTVALQNSISVSLAVMVAAPVSVVGLAALLFWEHPGLTLVSLLVFPLCIVPIVVYSRKARRASEAIQTNVATLSSLMHEAFTGNRVIKAYNLEDTVHQQFHATSWNFVGQYMRVVRAQEIPGPLIEFFGALGVALIFYYIASGAKTTMTPADFLEFVGSIFLMYQPIKSLTRLHNQLEQARAASRRVFELLETRNTIAEPPQPVALRAANVPIQFDNVDFSYGDKLVLKQIRLAVAPGQVVALVGASGSGKTTLTNLLLRFYDPQHGAIRIGGTDIRQVTTRDLRSQIAVVAQETILFNDTVHNNIALGRPGASEDEIIAAAKHAHAHEFILEKPQGYGAVIGEKGVTLSGGQRQRLAIARAILKNAPILILDEATSALDTESERAVQAALEELMQGRTTLCIAHRLSTVQNADLIVVLDQGRIVEMGKHTELVRRGGVYQKLYELQFQAEAPSTTPV